MAVLAAAAAHAACAALLVFVLLPALVSPAGAKRHHSLQNKASLDDGASINPNADVAAGKDYEHMIGAPKPPAMAKHAHTGWLYSENLAIRYPTMFQSSGRVLDRQAGVEAAVRMDQMFADDAPILFPAAEGHHAAVCVSQKAGSSRWKMILLKAQTGNFTLNIHHTQASWLKGISHEHQIGLIHKPETLRIMFVRDPYARLLSGFLDKACHAPPGQWENMINSEYDGPYTGSSAEFARFVRHLMAMRAQGKTINRHFSPLMEHCGLSSGMRYDLYLKAEEMDDWYPDVATFLGLTEAASSGFDTRLDPEDTDENNTDILDCFYPLTGSTCTETSAYLKRYKEDPNADIPRPGSSDGPAAWQKVQNLGHSHGADGLIGKYYTKEVTELAYLMLEKDLEAFGYPKLEFP